MIHSVKSINSLKHGGVAGSEIGERPLVARTATFPKLGSCSLKSGSSLSMAVARRDISILSGEEKCHSDSPSSLSSQTIRYFINIVPKVSISFIVLEEPAFNASISMILYGYFMYDLQVVKSDICESLGQKSE